MAAASLVLLGTLAARAEEPSPLRATVQCDRPGAPGRFRCDVEARVNPRLEDRAHPLILRWGDVEVVSAAPFITTLRGRSGPREAAAHEDDLWRWELGMVGRDHGEGDITVRVRAVLCDGATCTPYVAIVVAHVTVP